ncbi:riboflavin synthase subunit alpha [Vibrio sp. S4M6]|uniref:riboflavin synthase subunit alpha n=1 Tax=Vibrio sinus TaxID=2946865 RepID=UPI00202A0D0F|nr:riboflavin synthase subunit alpha [Vibrio sinus]MCL9783299.1 riboflavin synthase subunit alpha [Vibrio sinus]
MFTGIVRGMAQVESIEKKQDFQTHIVRLSGELSQGIEIGASVAHNGCCLTVTQIDDELVTFDLMNETLSATNLSQLSEGDYVNIERAAKFGDEIGGHNMSGHISVVAEITQVIETPNNKTLWFLLPLDKMKYVLEKGYIGLDGCSLTIGEVKGNAFNVHLIPETLNRTLFGRRQVGDKVNVEFDPQTQAIVDTVERVMDNRLKNA